MSITESDAAVNAITRTAERFHDLQASWLVRASSWDGVNHERATEARLVAEIYQDCHRIIREEYP